MLTSTPGRSLYLFGEIIEENCFEIIEQLTEIIDSDKTKKKNKPIDLFISSSGGEVEPSFAVYDFIVHIKELTNLRTISLGETASAAVHIFLAGTKRYIAPNSHLLIHRPRLVFPNAVSLGDDEMDSHKEGSKKTRGKIIDIIEKASQGKLSGKKIAKMLKKETAISPQQAIQYGLAHGILEKGVVPND